MDTLEIWRAHSEEIYFFILKRVKDSAVANDILQNTFYKVHKYRGHIDNLNKIRPWIFQISRNETTDYFKREARYTVPLSNKDEKEHSSYKDICCFDRFIEELPAHYKSVIQMVYIDGKTQTETAKLLKISLTNVKARIRRSKSILKQKFKECCNYEIDRNGMLTGEADCARCIG